MAPSFFLESSDSSGDWAVRRACEVLHAWKGPAGEDCVRVRVTPIVVGQRFGFGGTDIEWVVLSPRFYGDKLVPLSAPVVHVKIWRPSTPTMEAQGIPTPESLILAAWGEVYAV